jgi:hypothetical protein
MCDNFPGSDLHGLVKNTNSRRANFGVMRRTYRPLNDCEMQHNAGVGLFTRPSTLIVSAIQGMLDVPYHRRWLSVRQGTSSEARFIRAGVGKGLKGQAIYVPGRPCCPNSGLTN